MKRTTTLSTLSAVLLLIGGVAIAAPGRLDDSFGTDGRVVTAVPPEGVGQALVRRPDGGLVVAGRLYFSGYGVLIAYKANGVLDTTFGTGGQVSMAPIFFANAVLLTSGGKVVAVGTDQNHNFTLSRYLADGTLDTSFGAGGIATVDNSLDSYSYALAQQSDGKLVVAGHADYVFSQQNHTVIIVARRNADGTPDLFAAYGSETAGIQFSPYSNFAFANAVVVAPDGSIAAAGWTFIGSNRQFALGRLQADGTPDPSFGDGGRVLTPYAADAVLNALVRLPDGRLVAAGLADGDFVLVRYLSDGSLDPSFGNAGIVTTDFAGGTDAANGLVVRPDGGLVAVGVSASGSGDGRFALARYDQNGTLDPSFGNDGLVTTDFPEGPSSAAAVVRGPDDTLTVAGTAGPNGSQGFALARYRDDDGNGCAPVPQSGCKTPTIPLQARLKLRDATPDKTDQVIWKWRKGQATALADFGDPVTTDDYTLCMYDESAASTLRFGARAPHGGTCRSKPCWTPVSDGFKYKDPDRTPGGLSTITLGAGVDEKAKILVQGKGGILAVLPPLPLALPFRVQLTAASGQCWEAVYSSSGVIANDASQFSGKAD